LFQVVAGPPLLPTNNETYDIAVIGGGINGAGIARDAAGRGYRVFLAEQGDLAQGTSSGSTKLIHGGLRYLEHYEFGLVREALKEREVLLSIAPHIVRPMRFVLPVEAGMRPAWLIRAGLILYDHLGGRKRLAGTRRLDLSADPAGAALKRGATSAFEYADCWVDDARLVVLNAVDAAARGATIAPRTRVLRARSGNEGGDRDWIVQVEHGTTGRVREIKSRVLVNAAGPWADAVSRTVLGDNRSQRVRLVKGSHVVVPRLFDHERSYTFQARDGRVMFAIPYEGRFTLLGTTEVDYEGDPGQVAISAAERDYILEIANQRFVRQTAPRDIVWSFAAVRPLVDEGGGRAQDQSRGYRIDVSHEAGAGLITITGGKITTYRKLAESVLVAVDAALGRKTGNWTGTEALPGGDFDPDGAADETRRLAARYPFLDMAQCARLLRTYGTKAQDVLGDARQPADLGESFDGGLTSREVAYLREREWARTSEDILWRRTKLGLFLTPGQRAGLEALLDPDAAASP
jgi:glycerol-3-phosphate dehydrogenase